jgi:DNA-3-methyladenine glycosylase
MPRPHRRPFFARDVHAVARDLIGATLRFKGAGGRIVEVEAYHHTDPAAHSYNGKTPRNAVMFGPPGYAYVYRSYGIHWCVNFVCEEEGSASAVLIRAIEPTHDLALMSERRGTNDPRALCSGPGKLCQALGISLDLHGLDLVTSERLWIAAGMPAVRIAASGRIGISRGQHEPWRFWVSGNPYVSAHRREVVPAGGP